MFGNRKFLLFLLFEQKWFVLFLPFLKRRQYNMMSIENDERIKALEIDRNHDELYFLVGWGRTFKDIRAQNLPTSRFFPNFCCS